MDGTYRKHCVFYIVEPSAMSREKSVGVEFVICLAQETCALNGTNFRFRFTQRDYG